MIVNKYNNTYHSTLKVEPVDVKWNTYINPSDETNDNMLNLKLVISLEDQNVKTFFKKAIFQIVLKKFFWLKRLKTLCLEHMLLVILKVKNY